MKRYISEHLPGDVALTNDDSIGLIVKVWLVTNRGRHLEWNFLYGGNALREDETVKLERYALDAIPGYHLSKLSWWTNPEFKQVLHGPLHQVLNEPQESTLRLFIKDMAETRAIPDAALPTLPYSDLKRETTEIENTGGAITGGGAGGLSSVAPFGRPWHKRK